MGARTGEAYLEGPSDHDTGGLAGDERVDDVVEHPALAAAAPTPSPAYYDLQHEYADDCLMPDPETGEPINVSHMHPAVDGAT